MSHYGLYSFITPVDAERSSFECSEASYNTHYQGLGLVPSDSVYSTSYWGDVQSRSSSPRHTAKRTASTCFAVLSRPFFRPHRFLSLLAILCAASYISRILPIILFGASEPVIQPTTYNPNVLYRPAASFEPILVPTPVASSHHAALTMKPKTQRPSKPNPKHAAHMLPVRVFDGVLKAQAEQIEAMQRIEESLREADEEDETFLVEMERLEDDWAEKEETESASKWLEANARGSNAQETETEQPVVPMFVDQGARPRFHAQQQYLYNRHAKRNPLASRNPKRLVAR